MPPNLERVPVAPGAHSEAYAPLELPSHAEEALDSLMDMTDDEARNALTHTVDPILLEDLTDLLLNIAVVSKEAGSKASFLRERVVEQRLITTKRRATPIPPARLRGEEEQLGAEEVGPVFARMTAREKERRFHARKLWELCGVQLQVEMIAFPKSADAAEVSLIQMIGKRRELLYHDAFFLLREGAIPLPDGSTVDGRGFDHVPVFLASAARRLASSGNFGTVPGPEGPMAASCIHELRFYGHGKPGGGGEEASFKFADSLTKTSDLEDPLRHMNFGVLRSMVAPGASILLEGCETGRGPAGKEFLGALAKLCIGTSKWGFVRASTQEIVLSPRIEEGPVPGDPVTLRWPDDF